MNNEGEWANEQIETKRQRDQAVIPLSVGLLGCLDKNAHNTSHVTKENCRSEKFTYVCIQQIHP